MNNIIGKDPIQQTAASQVTCLAQEVAELAREVRDIADKQLSPLRHDAPQEGPEIGKVRQSFPEYFETLRINLEQIRSSLYETRGHITRCEI